MAGETKVCPVCDSPLQANARRCPECNTDLSLFDIDGDAVPDMDKVSGTTGKSIDDILESIVAGKALRPDIFEDMKTIAGDHATPENDILSDSKVEAGVEFECPNCGAKVAGDAKACPTCGATFAEEAVEQFECPLCNAVVEMNAKSCPNCGVAFAEEPEAPVATQAPPAAPAAPTPPAKPPVRVEPPAPRVLPTPEPSAPVVVEVKREERPPPAAVRPAPERVLLERLWSTVESRKKMVESPITDRAGLYKELPKLVNDVKPLLLTAKKVDVDIRDEKQLISEAIAQGKKRDVEKAVVLIRKARHQLENAFTAQLAKRIEDVLIEAERARAAGTDVAMVVRFVTEAIDALEAKDYQTAGDRIRAAKEESQARSGGYAKAFQELESVRELVTDTKRLGLALRDVEGFLARGEAAMTSKSYDQAATYAMQARQVLLKALPEVLTKEMKKARNALLDIKVRGGDLTKSVGYLKQASIHMKREEYANAVRFVRMFQEEVGRA